MGAGALVVLLLVVTIGSGWALMVALGIVGISVSLWEALALAVLLRLAFPPRVSSVKK